MEAAALDKTGSGKETRPEAVLRSLVLDEISEILRRTRGRELPGTHNSLIVGDLFLDHASPWPSLTEHPIVLGLFDIVSHG